MQGMPLALAVTAALEQNDALFCLREKQFNCQHKIKDLTRSLDEELHTIKGPVRVYCARFAASSWTRCARVTARYGSIQQHGGSPVYHSNAG